MTQDALLTILRCPEDHSLLSSADQLLISQVNERIASGRLQNRAGRRVEKPIDGGLIRAAGDVLYPIVDQIPVMLAEEAIPLNLLKD
jgi:uncharacterized protein YbaR (Trm112 family)